MTSYIGAALAGRADASWTGDMINNSTTESLHAHADAAIEDIRFEAARSIRTSIITLSSFNIVAAAATLACILWDCYRAAKKEDPKLSVKSLRPRFVAPTETFPLILSVGIVIQGIIFAVAQSKGLKGLSIDGCIPVAQMMMPATFLVPLIQLIFGLETTVRALLRKPFPARPKWDAPLCLLIVILGLVALYVTTLSFRPPESCFASLAWFTQAWRLVCFALLTAIAATLLVSCGIIFTRLRTSSTSVSLVERISATHMVYFAASGVVINALIIPFWYKVNFVDPETTGTYEMDLSTIASIASNLTGVFTGGLYLFLRTSRNRLLASGPSKEVDDDDDDHFNEKQLEKGGDSWHQSFPVYYNQPVKKLSPSVYSQSMYFEDAPPEQPTEPMPSSRRTTWRFGGRDTGTWASTASSRIPSMFEMIRPAARGQPAAQPEPSPQLAPEDRQSRVRKSSVGLLPATTYNSSREFMPPSTSSLEDLIPPPLLTNAGGFHRRDSSLESMATVQIGLRLSNMNDIRPMPSPKGALNPKPREPSTTNSFLRVSRQGYRSAVESFNSLTGKSTKSEEFKNKQLPDIPNDDTNANRAVSPMVSSPVKPPGKLKLVSPKGVGFGMAPGGSPSRAQAQPKPAGWI